MECAGASSFSDHSSLPLRASNARKRPSMVAPIKTRSPAVVILPPRLGVPVFIPLASSSSKMPSGTCQAISPVFTLTATSSPHGGALHEYFVLGSQNRPPSGVTLRYVVPFPSSASAGAPPPPQPPRPRPPRPPPPRGWFGSTFSTWPHWPAFITFVKIMPSRGLNETPFQFPPPTAPGNRTIFRPSSHGV